MMRPSLGMLTMTAALVCAGGGLAGCKGDKPSAHATSAPSAAPAEQPAPATLSEPRPPAPAAGEFAGVDAYDAPALSRVEMPSGVVIEELKVGEGEAAFPRAFVTFHYRAKVQGGQEFYSSTEVPEGPKPESQSLDRLIPGLATGMVGMKSGGRRRLTVPPSLAPGVVGIKDEKGNLRIPPDATLVYVVDAVAIRQQLITAPPQNRDSGAVAPPAP